MPNKLLIATILGSLLTAGSAAACLAGDASPTGQETLVRGQSVDFVEARASLDSAIEIETKATKELEAAVSANDSARIAFADAEEHLDELTAILEGGALSRSLRLQLEREAAEIRDTIDNELFARLDAARDRVTNAKHELREALVVKQAAIEQVRLAPPPGERLTYNANYPLPVHPSVFE